VAAHSLRDWHFGVGACVLIGFLQDPIRKFVPGEPAYLSLLIGPLLFIALMGMRNAYRGFYWGPLYGWNIRAKTALNAYILIIVLQVLHGFVSTGSAQIAIIGVVNYVVPILVLLLLCSYFSTVYDDLRVVRLYVIMAAGMISGVYFEVFDLGLPLLGSVGPGVYMTSWGYDAVKLPSGFFRAAETAAWHGANAIMMTVVLAVSRKRSIGGAFVSGLIVIIILGAVLLTGRRKMIVDLFLFVSVYWLLLVFYGREKRRLFLTVLVPAVLGLSFYVGIYKDGGYGQLDVYASRNSELANSAEGRFVTMTYYATRAAISAGGVVGHGAGVASQGSQHTGVDKSAQSWAAEAGGGKIIIELGVPGFLVTVWLLIAYVGSIRVGIREAVRNDWGDVPVLLGFIAIVFSNSIVFMTASQVFGDPFVLFVISMLVAYIFAKIHSQNLELNGYASGAGPVS